jgi:hypothetical protein
MARGTLAIASLDIDCLPLESGLGMRRGILCRYSLERVVHNGGTAGLARDGRGAWGPRAVFAVGWLSAIGMGYTPVIAAPFAITGLMEVLIARGVDRLVSRL